MEIGMATVKLATEADRLMYWLKQFKPEQRYMTFPNSFGGQPIQKILPKLAHQREDGTWIYGKTKDGEGFEIRFPPLAEVTVRPMPTTGTRNDPHRIRSTKDAHVSTGERLRDAPPR